MTRIVSVTPTAVERDSRTFKHAASLARLGHTSIVLEGEPSELVGAEVPFELASVGGGTGRRPANGGAPSHPAPNGSRVHGSRALRRILDLPITVAAQLRWNLRTYRALADADLYYLHSYNQFIATYLKARRRGVPFIYDAHDSYWEEDSSPDGALRGRLSRRFMEAVERACVRRADRLTTVSGGVADLLESRFGRRPEVIRNCPDRRLDRAARSDLRATIDAPKGAFLLVSVGNAKQGDTIEEALAAVQELPAAVQLAFVGRGYEHHRERTRALGLESRVHFLPAVAPTEVADFISTADASPILYRAYTANFLNALPNRFFHAVAAGLPLIYPPLVEIAALAERYDLGLPVDPTDPASVVEAVNALRGDPELVRHYRANVERAREELSWEREEGAIEKLVAATLAERSAGA